MSEFDIDLEKCLKNLSKKRPVFHSEADFQFALAWELKEEYPDADIRLEYRMQALNDEDSMRNKYVDIIIRRNNHTIPIELKYKTKKLNFTHNGESFVLKEQSAQDIGRYDCIKDIYRLEKLTSKLTPTSNGYVIWLTNDPAYWNKPKKDDFYWRDFSIENGKKLNEYNEWHEAGAGSIKGREEPIELEGFYTIQWENYSELDSDKYGEFRYVLLQIPSKRD